MNPLHTARTVWRRPEPAFVDDAYTAWFNAHARCGRAIEAWRAASPEDRVDAHRAYVAELDIEEAAARELERLHTNLRMAA